MSSDLDTRPVCECPRGIGGLVQEEVRLGTQNDEPKVNTWVVRLGNIGQLQDRPNANAHINKRSLVAQGTGSSLDPKEALVRAHGEAWERYCTYLYQNEQFIFASAAELGTSALDLDTIPKCSKAELSNPRCPLVAPKKDAPIRWILGLSLLTGCPIYLPAVMVYLRTGYTSRDERICLPITTGCAAHNSLEKALLGAILEVVERDAISIAWLQKLPLPRIELDLIHLFKQYWESYQRGSKNLDYAFFDATTDLGIPIIYGLQISRMNRYGTTLVSCSSALNPVNAIKKVMTDMGAFRRNFRTERSVPDSWDDFTEIMHGATYMARAEQASAFNFILDSNQRRPLSAVLNLGNENKGNDRETLSNILDIFRGKQLEVFAVDITTDEALRFGVRSVRVIIPGLQPLSLNYRAKYLGHSRLYTAPKQMGYRVLSEDQLNQWPQPFA